MPADLLRTSRAGWLLAVLVAGAAPPPPEVAPAVLDGLAAARRDLGLPALERRASVTEAALRRARRVADRPEEDRLSLPEPVEDDLRAVGVTGLHRARMHLDLQQGGRQPAAGILERWRRYRAAWEDAVDPSMDAVGAAAVEARDGWLVFVAILVEDQRFPPDLLRAERRIDEEVNARRQQVGLAPLEFREDLAELARRHSRDMAERDYFDHVTPEGIDLAERARRLGIGYARIAENIAVSRGARDPIEVAVEGWMESEGHRRNLLGRSFTRTGVGVARDPSGTLYFTQVFLLPPPGSSETR